METLNVILNMGLVLMAAASFSWRVFTGKRTVLVFVGLIATIVGAAFWAIGTTMVGSTLLYGGVLIWIGLTLFEDVAKWRAARTPN